MTETTDENPNIPLETQRFMFDELAGRALGLANYILEHDNDLLAVARERLEDGYKLYGSEMYGWSAEERKRNVIEELADALVYLTSGPIV